jgi:hypothetical protein
MTTDFAAGNTGDQFDDPGSAEGIKWDDLNGRLLLITPLAVEKDVSTVHGPTTAVRADIGVVDGPNAGKEIKDTLIFPKVLQSQVKGNAGTGRMNLGRLGKGAAKPGQSAPWKLAAATDAEKAAARAYLDQPPY